MSDSVKDAMARPDWFPRCACGRSVLNDGDACTVCQPNDVVPRSATLAEDVRWLREQKRGNRRMEQYYRELDTAGVDPIANYGRAANESAALAARYARIADALETHLRNAATIASGDDAPVVSLSERRSADAPGVGAMGEER